MKKVSNKSLKDAASPLDSTKRRMLRILCAACARPLAQGWASQGGLFAL